MGVLRHDVALAGQGASKDTSHTFTVLSALPLGTSAVRLAARMGCLVMTLACPKPLSLYRPRDPRASDLWRLLDEHFDSFRQVYDEQFQAKYGFWRPVVDQALDMEILKEAAKGNW